jgi:hypothetical protein
MIEIEKALKIVPADDRHELGCVKRYGATETGKPDTDEQAAKCSCHLKHNLTSSA